MKHSLLLAASCLGLCLSLGAAAQVISDPVYSWTSGNVVYEFNSTDGTNSAGNLTINYYDDFGRLQQTVQSNYVPDKDLATWYDYDVRGNMSCVWLPAVISQNYTKYVDEENCKTACGQTYGDDVCYSTFEYESSSPNRLINQKKPGGGWGSGASITTNYLTNTQQECWDIQFTGNDSYFVREYPSGKLYVTRTRTEDNAYVVEYKDFNGRLICSRQEDGFGNTETCDTYYVYDDLGRLRAIFPPKCAGEIRAGDFSFSSVENSVYLYRYDAADHLIAKKLPDADWIYYIYDAADRSIFSQTGNQREKGEWSFRITDVMGRECLTGICENTFDPFSQPVIDRYITCTYAGTSGVYMGYDITGVSLVSAAVHTANYYDNYDMGFDVVIPIITEHEISIDIYWLAQGLLTGTATARLDDAGVTGYDYCEMYYDNRDRLVVQAKSPNLSNEYETEITEYNYSGQPVCFKRSYFPTASGSSSEVSPSELYTYTYDDWGRLLTTTHRIGENGTTVVLVDNVYDDLGRLATNKRNSNADLITDYSYNTRSWLSSISNPLFSQTLYYQENFENYNFPRNGGDISAMTWMTASDPQRGYIFSYDGLSRLTAAEYLENNVESEKFGVSYSYDKHGNILALQRYGRINDTEYGRIDNMEMFYRGNKLINILSPNLGIAHSFGFEVDDVSGTPFEMATYDLNGNLTKDLSRGISEIKYNSLNLPSKITFATPGLTAVNKYVYSAVGEKLSTTLQSGESEFTTLYVGSKIYENGSLKRTLVDGGYVEDGQYYYFVTDHLGSTRVVARADGEVVQTNDYYPFGLSLGEGVDTSDQPYKYNGKELDLGRGLNLYDYGARLLASDWGRFTTIDPLSEKYPWLSPYAYCANNPIRFVDPDGRELDWYLNESSGELYYNKDLTAESITYNDQNYTRVGDNGLMGDMGEVSEQSYNSGDSQTLASQNNFSILPNQQLVQENTSTTTHPIGPRRNVEVTNGKTTVINTNYSLVSVSQEMEASVSQILETNNDASFLSIGVQGAKNMSKTYVQNYMPVSKTSHTGRKIFNAASAILGGKHNYVQTVTYPSWKAYSKETNGIGPLMRYRNQ